MIGCDIRWPCPPNTSVTSKYIARRVYADFIGTANSNSVQGEAMLRRAAVHIYDDYPNRILYYWGPAKGSCPIGGPTRGSSLLLGAYKGILFTIGGLHKDPVLLGAYTRILYYRGPRVFTQGARRAHAAAWGPCGAFCLALLNTTIRTP